MRRFAAVQAHHATCGRGRSGACPERSQELYVEGGGAAAADAVESVQVLELGDHAFGVSQPLPVGPTPCRSSSALVLAARAVARSCVARARRGAASSSLAGCRRRARARRRLPRRARLRSLGRRPRMRARAKRSGHGRGSARARHPRGLRRARRGSRRRSGPSVDRDLAAIDEVRTLCPGFPFNLASGSLCETTTRMLAFRSPSARTRLRHAQLPRVAGLGGGGRLVRRFAGDRFQARAQAPQRRIGLGVEAVDGEMAALDQPVLLAQRNRAQEQPLEHLAISEALRLRLRDRLVRWQPLTQPVAEKQAQIETEIRDPQQLPHRPDPLQRPGDHQLQQHARIDRRPPDTLAVIRPRSLTHKPPVADQLIDPPIPILSRHQLVQADHRDLTRRPLRPCLTHRHRQPSLARQHNPCLECRTRTGPQMPTFRTRPLVVLVSRNRPSRARAGARGDTCSVPFRRRHRRSA